MLAAAVLLLLLQRGLGQADTGEGGELLCVWVEVGTVRIARVTGSTNGTPGPRSHQHAPALKTLPDPPATSDRVLVPPCCCCCCCFAWGLSRPGLPSGPDHNKRPRCDSLLPGLAERREGATRPVCGCMVGGGRGSVKLKRLEGRHVCILNGTATKKARRFAPAARGEATQLQPTVGSPGPAARRVRRPEPPGWITRARLQRPRGFIDPQDQEESRGGAGVCVYPSPSSSQQSKPARVTCLSLSPLFFFRCWCCGLWAACCVSAAG